MNLRRAIVVIAATAFVAAYAAWQLSGISPEPISVAPPPGANALPASAGAVDEAVDIPRSQAAIAAARPGSCTIVTHYLPNDDGTTTEVVSCEPHDAEQVHPYAGYPDAALESLAYADAKAAEVLGMRLVGTDAEAAMSLALRAAALSGGDATPIVAYANAYPEPTAVDGVPVRRTVHVKYVLGTVTQLLGDPRHGVPYFEAMIREHSTDPDREIALLNERAQQMIEEMRQIQLDVTGSSTIGG